MNQDPGYKTSKDQLLGRLARVEGQIRGVTRMVEEERYCIDVLTQIQAAEAALNSIALGLLDGHVRNCMQQGNAKQRTERASEMMEAVGRLVRG